MKITKQILVLLFVVTAVAFIGCASGPRVTVIELENKGSINNIPTPEWVRLYIAQGVSSIQALPQFRDRYVIVGEETGINLQFVRSFADTFSAQQRIGAMLRTTIVSEFQARVHGAAETVGGGTPGAGMDMTGLYQQEIDSIINTVVNASYSGAQREADWWSLRRRYDPDFEGVFRDEYTAYVLYTIPRSEMNRQVARALETSVSADSALYEITIEIARNLMLNGISNWGE